MSPFFICSGSNTIYIFVHGRLSSIESFILFMIKLSSLDSMDYPYTYPLSPISSKELSDSLIKYDTSLKYRNLLL